MKSDDEMRYIDIHGHLNFAAYDADRDAVIERARQAEVGIVNVGSEYQTSLKAVELARKNENMWAVVGVHPVHTVPSNHDEQEFGASGKIKENILSQKGEDIDLNKYVELARDEKVIAIGECGLDYFHLDDELRKEQIKGFEKMIALAEEVKKPLMLHLRNGSGKSAYNDAYEILKNHPNVKGDLHFFAGSIEEAKPFLDLGYYFSFTGVITFARSYDEVIKYIPLNRIMSETDCPYVAPIPYRGKRNEPSYVVEVVKAIAKIKGEEEEKVRVQVLENACKFFTII